MWLKLIFVPEMIYFMEKKPEITYLSQKWFPYGKNPEISYLSLMSQKWTYFIEKKQKCHIWAFCPRRPSKSYFSFLWIEAHIWALCGLKLKSELFVPDAHFFYYWGQVHVYEELTREVEYRGMAEVISWPAVAACCQHKLVSWQLLALQLNCQVTWQTTQYKQFCLA